MPSMLWSHDPSEPIGVWLDAREDAKGLLLTGKLSMDVQRAAEARALAKDGALALSIGFQTRDAGYDKGRRILKDVRLLEVSLVSMPMNPQAKLIDVKGVAASEIRSAIAFERFLKAKVLQTRWRAVWRLAGMPQSVVVTRTRKNFSNKSAPTHRASMEPNMTDLSEIKTAFDENAKAVTKSINEACAE